MKQAILKKFLKIVYDQVASRSLGAISAKKCKLLCDPILANLVTDFTEGKNLSCSLQSISTAMPCTGCKVEKGQLSKNSDKPLQWRRYADIKSAREKSVKIIKKANELKWRKGDGKLRYQAKTILLRNSLPVVTSFYDSWRFLDGEVHKLLDACRIFGFERLHNLPIEVMRIILEAATNSTARSDVKSLAMLTEKRSQCHVQHPDSSC